MSSSLDDLHVMNALGGNHWENQQSFQHDLNKPDMTWNKADVWQDEGMWLHGIDANGSPVIVYFEHVNCGESAEATYATMNVLRSAGFVLTTTDLRHLETRNHNAFTKE